MNNLLLTKIEIAVQKANPRGWKESRAQLVEKSESLILQFNCLLNVTDSSEKWHKYYQLFHFEDWEEDETEISRIMEQIYPWLTKIAVLIGKTSRWEQAINKFNLERMSFRPYRPAISQSSFLLKATEINHQRRMNLIRWNLALKLLPNIMAQEYQHLKKVLTAKKALAEKKKLVQKKKLAEKNESMMAIHCENKAKYEEERVKNSKKWDLNDPRQYQSYLKEERRISRDNYWSDPFN